MIRTAREFELPRAGEARSEAVQEHRADLSIYSIEWDRQRETLRYLREHGDFPSAHYSHDHLNAQIPVPIADALQQEWKDKFATLLEKEKAKALKEGQEELQIIIADGFLMLVDPESARQFDVRLFVREEYAELKRRREERHGYVSRFWLVGRDRRPRC
jgi:nicotinamide/nicotinate riboside kinase